MFPADIWEYPIPKIGNFSFRFLGKTLDEIHCIQRKGYCTEKEVVYILGNQYRYEVTDTQIKRCLNEIMDSYGLKKVKANKVLKEQYNIKSDGYPNIIIGDIN